MMSGEDRSDPWTLRPLPAGRHVHGFADILGYDASADAEQWRLG